MPATVIDGYERNATFAADDRPVAADELEQALRWLDHAHADFVEVSGRVHRFEEAGGRLPAETRDAAAVADGADDGREARAVIRHVAGAETWLTSRLDRSLRFAGADPELDLDAYVEQTHAWSKERLRELWARDPGLSGTDGKGETWTLAKVLRRQIYHLLDHADELDRRLCQAEGCLDRVRIQIDGYVPGGELIRAGASRRHRRRPAARAWSACDAPWRARSRTSAPGTATSWSASPGWSATACPLAYVSFVVIHPRWQDRGLGRRVMDVLLDGREEDKLILEARGGAEPFYERLGFEPISWAMVRHGAAAG